MKALWKRIAAWWTAPSNEEQMDEYVQQRWQRYMERNAGVMAAPASPTDAQILELARQQGDEAEHGFIFNKDGRWSVLTFARALLALGVDSVDGGKQ